MTVFNTKTIVFTALFLSVFSFFSAHAQDAKEIAYKVYNRPVPKDGESNMTMTLINKKGKQRTRKLHQYFIDLGAVEKQTMFFTAPADVKNTAFMNWSYDDVSKNDEQWLYLPALKKVKRIANSNKDNEFMGSDFTYADMEKRSPERDVHQFIKSELLQGEDCWVVQATPKEEELYTKKIAWISKSRHIPLKIDFYDEDDALLKTLTIIEAIQVSTYWIIVKQVMENVQKNHKTNIQLTDLKVDKGLEESTFTQRKMQRGL